MALKFKLETEVNREQLVFAVNTGDGDFNISVNGVDLGYIDKNDGKLHLFQIGEDERECLPGLSLSNGRLTVA